MRSPIQTCCALVFILAAGLMSAGCHQKLMGGARDTICRTFSVAPGGKLTLDSDIGSIEVNSGAIDRVSVDIERQVRAIDDMQAQQELAQTQPEFRQDGNNISIFYRHSGDHLQIHWGKARRMRFVVTVPNRYDLQLRTGGGSITVRDIEGTVAANTSGGSLNFGHIVGSIDGHTSGGSIRVGEIRGPVNVNTSGGGIQIGRVEGTVDAHSSGGSISVEEVQGAIRASTSGGSVNAAITRQPATDCELSTSGGSIHARVARGLDLELSAKTGGGSVRTSLPLTIVGEMSRQQLEARLNHGGPQLRLHTSGGGISIDGID